MGVVGRKWWHLLNVWWVRYNRCWSRYQISFILLIQAIWKNKVADDFIIISLNDQEEMYKMQFCTFIEAEGNKWTKNTPVHNGL